MYHRDDGNIGGISWLSGQVASITKDGEIIKAVSIGQQDVKLDPSTGEAQQINEIIMNDLKTPSCIVWDSTKGYTAA